MPHQDFILPVPFTAQDFLNSVARTPTPRRFTRRRQCLLEARPRLAHEDRTTQISGDNTNVQTFSLRDGRALEGSITRTLSDNQTLEQSIRMARLKACDVVEVDQVKDNKMIDDQNNAQSRDLQQISASSVGSLTPSRHQIYGGNPGYDSILEGAQTIYEKSQIAFNCAETSTHEKIEPVPEVLGRSLIALQKKKSSRRNMKHLRTYGNRNAKEYQRATSKTHMPRNLVVDELELVQERVLSHLIQDPDTWSIEIDDDSIREFPPAPIRESRTKRKYHKTTRVIKKRGLLEEILGPNAPDLSQYKLPDTHHLSPNAKKRLKIGMTCSDGFEGTESHPTGTIMPMRLSRRPPTVTRQSFARVTELTLTSSRNTLEYTKYPKRLYEDSIQSEAGESLYQEATHEMKDIFKTIGSQLPEFLRNKGKIDKACDKTLLEDLSQLLPSFERDIIHSKEVRRVTSPQNTHRIKPRVTFSNDVGIRIIQALTMVSAPIAISSPYSSDEEEESVTDNEDSRSGSCSSNLESDEEAKTDSDDNHDSDDDTNNSETDVEVEREIPSSVISLTASSQNPGHKESLETTEQVNYPGCQRLHWSDDLDHWDNIHNYGKLRKIHSADPSDSQSTTERVGVSMIGQGHQRWDTEADPQRPKGRVSTRHLIKVNDDILNPPGSPIELREPSNNGVPPFSESTCAYNSQIGDEYVTPMFQVGNEDIDSPQERDRSQTSVELGDSDWSVPYSTDSEQTQCRTQKRDYPTLESRCHTVKRRSTYLAQALDKLNKASQGNFCFLRSKSVPSNYRFHGAARLAQEAQVAPSFEISLAYK